MDSLRNRSVSAYATTLFLSATDRFFLPTGYGVQPHVLTRSRPYVANPPNATAHAQTISLRRVAFWSLWTALMLLMSLYVTALTIPSFANMGYESRHSLPKVMQGESYRPFVYRVLMPAIIVPINDLVTRVTPASLNNPVDGFFLTLLPQHFLYSPDYIRAAEVTYIVMSLFLLLFAVAFHKLCEQVFDMPRPLTIALTVLSLFGATFLGFNGQIYDNATVALFTLGYLALLRRQWFNYLLIFAMACLNKETAPFLTLVMVTWTLRERLLDQRTFWKLLAVQGAIYGVIRVGTMVRFANNPGSVIENHFALQLWHYTNPGYLANTTLLVGVLCFFTLFIRYRFSQQPRFLQTAIWLALPIAVLFVFFGYPYEIRVFFEVYPIAMLMVGYTIASALRSRVVCRQDLASVVSG